MCRKSAGHSALYSLMTIGSLTDGVRARSHRPSPQVFDLTCQATGRRAAWSLRIHRAARRPSTPCGSSADVGLPTGYCLERRHEHDHVARTDDRFGLAEAPKRTYVEPKVSRPARLTATERHMAWPCFAMNSTECRRQVGTRNQQLNRSAFAVTEIVAGGELLEGIGSLLATAQTIGLDSLVVNFQIKPFVLPALMTSPYPQRNLLETRDVFFEGSSANFGSICSIRTPWR
jgi:hypothetical protein